jgi:hypothetical protein
MNTRSRRITENRPLGVLLIALLIICGCSQTISSIRPTLTPKATPTAFENASQTPKPVQSPTPHPTATAVPSVAIVTSSPNIYPAPVIIPRISLGGMNLDILDKGKDYIIYHDIDPTTQQWVYWAINPVEKVPLIFYNGSEQIDDMGEWSPTQKYRLLQSKNKLYITSPDGTSLSLIYSDDHYQVIDGLWLSDSTIIINAYEELYVPAPDIYILNVDTGLLTPLDLSRKGYVQAVFPSMKIRVEVNWTTHETTLVRPDGSRQRILEDFKVNIAPWNSKVIQWIDQLGEFVFLGRRAGDQTYNIYAVSRDFGSPRILFDLQGGQTSGITLSPDIQKIMFNYNSPASPKIHTKIVNLITGQSLYDWIFPYEFSEVTPKWSPDSKYMVCPYSSSGPGPIPEVDYGIQIMNIKTGVTEVIVNRNVGRTGLRWEILNP